MPENTIFSPLIFLLLLYCSACNDKTTDNLEQTKDLQMVFYNTENLFDTIDDPNNAGDDEFLPDGEKMWTAARYQIKLQRLAEVFSQIGEMGGLPALIGLAEVENRQVLNDLLLFSNLPDERYAILHHESPDGRGIDVALLYDIFKLRLIEQKVIPIALEFAPFFSTRDILYAQFEVNDELLHVFVNHWTSRLGGTEASEIWRVAQAEILRGEIDALLLENADANIVVCGDFNDEPTNRSVIDVLNAKGNCYSLDEGELCNPFYNLAQSGEGSYKYGGWSMLDQFMVSQALMDARNGKLFIPIDKAGVFMPDWLMHYHTSFGYQPKRTYDGNDYIGGYSDHLPVYLHLSVNDGQWTMDNGQWTMDK